MTHDWCIGCMAVGGGIVALCDFACAMVWRRRRERQPSLPPPVGPAGIASVRPSAPPDFKRGDRVQWATSSADEPIATGTVEEVLAGRIWVAMDGDPPGRVWFETRELPMLQREGDAS